jgi:hypothetical protein
MPRKKAEQQADDTSLRDGDNVDDNSDVGYGGRHGHHQELIDPLVPLPGGQPIKYVKEQRPPRRKPGEASAGKQIYRDYLRALSRHGGDEVAAISEVLVMPIAEVEERRLELHEQILEEAGTGRSLQIMLKENDLNKEARVRILRGHVYSENPAASLKALQLVDEIDQTRVADSNSYESYLRELLGGRKKR